MIDPKQIQRCAKWISELSDMLLVKPDKVIEDAIIYQQQMTIASDLLIDMHERFVAAESEYNKALMR